MARGTSSWGRLPRRLASMAMALLCLGSAAAFAQAVPPGDVPSETVAASRPDGRRTMALLPASGHSSSAFALATVIESHFGPRVWVPAYAVSSLIAASRVRYSRHYLSDVVAGARAVESCEPHAAAEGASRPAAARAWRKDRRDTYVCLSRFTGGGPSPDTSA